MLIKRSISWRKLYISGIVLLVLMNLSLFDSVAASSEIWSQTYGGAAHSLVETSDGGFAFVGHIQLFEAEGTDFWLVKTDNFGNIEWNQTYDGSDQDRGSSLVETSDGGFALAGYTRSFGAGEYDGWLVKTDANGDMEWNMTFKGVVESLIETSDGGFALTGSRLLVKTDARGNIEWNQTHGGTSLVETSDGGFAYSGSGGSSQLVRTDANGNIQWSRSYGGPNYDSLHQMVKTSDGGYALAGETNSFSNGGADAWLVKTNGNGNMEWYNTYGGTSYEYPSSLVETLDGGFALAGVTFSFGGGKSDFWLVKTDELGNMEWNQTYGETGYEFAYSLVETSDGSFALIGSKSSFGAWLVKTIPQDLIPEFHSWTILFAGLTIALVLSIFYKQRFNKGRKI
ncbi:MAG: hypothetical protein P8X91_00740 [Candidatus Bathyarchaeota archaeon]